jgi:hypothetical protein
MLAMLSPVSSLSHEILLHVYLATWSCAALMSAVFIFWAFSLSKCLILQTSYCYVFKFTNFFVQFFICP